MGLDACFYVKTKDGEEPNCTNWIEGASVSKSCYIPECATHSIDSYWRYYGKGYERGDWPKISGLILCLMEAENVDSVWYCSDSEDPEKPFTLHDLNDLNNHYVSNGNRPYLSS